MNLVVATFDPEAAQTVGEWIVDHGIDRARAMIMEFKHETLGLNLSESYAIAIIKRALRKMNHGPKR